VDGSGASRSYLPDFLVGLDVGAGEECLVDVTDPSDCRSDLESAVASLLR
jgi:hypothetical protein